MTLGIHIADVSHYVLEGSALDREAYTRGTSVYLVTGVIPMLPERLSNNLCSLRPDEDRLAYSVFVRLSARGAFKEYEIAKSVMAALDWLQRQPELHAYALQLQMVALNLKNLK